MAGRTTDGAARLGLPPGVPLVLAGNDQTAGAYAAELHENRSLLITLGTAHAAYICTEALSEPGASIIRGAYPGGMHYRMVADSDGGSVVNWAKGVLAGCDTDEAFFRAAEEAEPGCRGLVFEARISCGKGSWKNVSLRHTPADFARSVVEALTGRVREMIRTLGVNAAETDCLVAGGGSNSPFWVRTLAETLGTTVTVTGADPLLGAAKMAADALELEGR